LSAEELRRLIDRHALIVSAVLNQRRGRDVVDELDRRPRAGVDVRALSQRRERQIGDVDIGGRVRPA
jgi:hypothetical protein